MPISQSSQVDYDAKMNDMQEMYENIKSMTEETYDKNTMIESLNIISVLPDFPSQYKKSFVAMVYKILTTVAGHIFLKTYKNFTIAVMTKAEECMRKLEDTYKTDVQSAELAKAISKFSIYNEQAFIEHGISYTTYYGYDNYYEAQEHYPEEEDDYYSDDEEYNEDDEVYHEEDEVYHEDDIEEYEEYVHGYEDDDDESVCKDLHKEINKKLKQLEQNLHINNVGNKKSCCFWDTCEFDNPPIYIPKHFINGTYHVYGCFCSPECGVAYLMNEHIDSSTKFERYHMFNLIYT